MAFDLNVNGTRHTVDADPQTPLLWVIRDHVGLTGTKFSCGIGQCGACTVHVDGQPVRSCSVPAAARPSAKESRRSKESRRMATIRSRSPGRNSIRLSAATASPGMIMSALALLQRRPNPSDADINASVTNACRCGTYHRVRQAIHLAADLMKDGRR